LISYPNQLKIEAYHWVNFY